jgi:hypothetical protein
MASHIGNLADVESCLCLAGTLVGSSAASLLGPLAATPVTQAEPVLQVLLANQPPTKPLLF